MKNLIPLIVLLLAGVLSFWGCETEESPRPVVITLEPTQIKALTTISGGTIVTNGGAPITNRGVCWSTNAEPTITDSSLSDNSDAGSFILRLTGLEPATKYYVRAFATNSKGTGYGETFSFTTVDGLGGVITTLEVTDITPYSASGGGVITDDGGAPIESMGVVWNTLAGPTLESCIGFTSDGKGLGLFNSLIEGLIPGTTYYVRAYSDNSVTVKYGNEVQFTALPVKGTVITEAVSNITTTTATSGGIVISDGGTPIIARGVVWGTFSNPTIAHNKSNDGNDLGPFESTITGLLQGVTYYLRAYVTNSEGTAYGDQIVFTTPDYAEVTTDIATSVTMTSAISGGNIVSDNGADVTSRGICWSTSVNPTLNDNYSTEGSGTGAFTSNISGLLPLTTYYVRAYATNIAGTSYGQQIQFTTYPETINPGEVFNPATGRFWMDRNLGASRVAQSPFDEEAFGDLYQWGRAADGHQIRTSETTTVLSSTDIPEHDKFIITQNSPYDWRFPQNNLLWQGKEGINNPCPPGFRLPTQEEWLAEIRSWSSHNTQGAFESALKLTAAGVRQHTGELQYVHNYGHYSSSTVPKIVTSAAMFLRFSISSNGLTSHYRGAGTSVRCIKD